MQITTILNEYTDYRAYVSHTLCKHRLFLGLDSAEDAILRLQDAAVWPLVINEANRMLALSSTLFGLESRALEDNVKPKVAAITNDLFAYREELLQGKADALACFREASIQLKDNLTSIHDLLRQSPPGFSDEAVLDYLNGRSYLDCLDTLKTMIVSSQQPIVMDLLQSQGDDEILYSQFWPLAADIYLQQRIAIVAGAVENAYADEEKRVRSVYRELQRIERLVSCWSPSIDAKNRAGVIDRFMEDNGFDGAEDIKKLFQRIQEVL